MLVSDQIRGAAEMIESEGVRAKHAAWIVPTAQVSATREEGHENYRQHNPEPYKQNRFSRNFTIFNFSRNFTIFNFQPAICNGLRKES